MHRSSSGSRVSEDSVVNSAQQQSITTTTNDSDHHHYPLHLPTYDPLSHAAKRERSRIRSAENAIHLIPLVLVLCAIILWFFSVDQSSMKAMKVDGDSDGAAWT